jgi:hypothetical protein
MEVQEGCIEPLEAHSLFCSLGEIKERNGYGNGRKGASFHGGLWEDLPLIYLWFSYFLGEGRTIGGRNTPSGHVLSLANYYLYCFLGEVAHKRIFLCKGLFYKEIRSKDTRLEWDRATSEEGTPCLGEFIFLDLYSILRGVFIVSGSFV